MQLRPYQVEGRDFLASRRHALLADEMRVGKTPQAILAAEKVGAKKVLVVCPAIAVAHWEQEFQKWWPGVRDGAFVTSYDKAKRHATELLAYPWDVTIVDECHFAKNPEAQRTKLIYGKGGLGWCSDRLWALSGTPMPNHPGELWPLLTAFGIVNATYEQFCWHYCDYDWSKTRIVGTKQKHIPELKQILATVMLRRTRKQVAPEMPGIDFQFLPVEPTSKVDLAGRYNVVFDAQLEEWMESHSAADREDRIEVAKAKVLPLVEQIAFAIDNELLRQTVVFGWHVESLQLVTRELRERGIKVGLITGQTSSLERVEIQYAFRRGELQVVVGQTLAAGTAIDLSAASHGYFLELDWVPGNNVQAANRLVSMDKAEPVTFDICTWAGSADDRVQRVLLRKTQSIKATGLA